MSSASAQVFTHSIVMGQIRDLYSGEGAQLYNALAVEDQAEVEEVRYAAALMAPGGSVIELAAGEGRLLLAIDPHIAGRYVAIDTSPVLLSKISERARRLGIDEARIQTCRENIVTWKPSPLRHDLAIIGAGSIRLFTPEQRRKIFSDIKTVLTSEGLLYISTSEPIDRHPSRLACLGQLTLPGKEVVAYLYEQRLDDQNAREIGFVVFDVLPRIGSARTYSSTVFELTGKALEAELRAAGFNVKETLTNTLRGLGGTQEKLTSLIASVGDH